MLKEGARSLSGYVIGIVALVLAFFTPFAGLIFGIIGLVQSSKQKNDLSKKGKIFSIIAIIVSVILIAASVYLYIKQGDLFANFPVA